MTRQEPGPGPRRADGAAPPASVPEALDRAAQHARRALAESVAAARALLDAVSLATRAEPSDTHRVLGTLARSLDDLAAGLEGRGGRGAWAETVLDALDVEIDRWERRSHTDPEARAVLRAFLGLREILWELGATGVRARRRPPSRAGGRAPRVQRVDIEG